MLLGEETSGNHQAYRRGHPDITILNEIIKGCEGVRQKLTQKIWRICVREKEYILLYRHDSYTRRYINCTIQ